MLQYLQSWRDQKTKTSKKVGALRAARVKTGNKKIDLPPLTDLDKKVLGLMGYDYIEGTSCPEEQVLRNINKLLVFFYFKKIYLFYFTGE